MRISRRGSQFRAGWPSSAFAFVRSAVSKPSVSRPLQGTQAALEQTALCAPITPVFGPPRSEPSLGDEDGLIEPQVTWVTGLDPLSAAKIVVGVVCCSTARECLGDLVVHFEQARVLQV